ncbi:guanine nucleotide binding protein, alpha subunit [Rickenella mellea]|uniref:Guanine nucleotide binding protein, alpha subunit n=1 Tax=Rickenella mellea TaxID=50990 RepID=A0A4Y7PYP5_9AGAM|nr:guanine nucleotide binding protein, alpha subunit [Rickenella mellea]
MEVLTSILDQRAKRKHSDKIDRIIKQDSKKLWKGCKILLLGSEKSGKSTIVKQMKVMYRNGFSREELLGYRLTIYRNVIESAQAIVNAMQRLGLGPDPVLLANRADADMILDYRIDESPHFTFSQEISLAIHRLWQDSIIPQILAYSSEFDLMDNASYFLSEVLRIGKPDYTPTVADVLFAQRRSVGIVETQFTLGQLSIHMIDIGAVSCDRRKWIHYFEYVTCIMFCAALNEYDQVLEGGQNRMSESLVHYESVANSRWFRRMSVILCFTKFDLFKHKIPKVPLEDYFPEYTEGPHVYKAARFILSKFIEVSGGMKVHPHFIQASHVVDILPIYGSIKDAILRNALHDAGIF